jgi:hypothetical protein
VQSKDFAIGVLSTTAVILFVGLILISSRPEPAYASGMGDRGGDYIMLSGELRDAEEGLYIIDTQTDLMIAYRFDLTRNRVLVRGGTDLKRFMAGTQRTGNPKKGRGRRRP